MDKTILWNQWLEEERIAHIHGWDFSHLDGRYEEEGDLPWDYRDTVRRYLRPDSRLLDLAGAVALVQEVFAQASVFEGEMPGKSAAECGNYRNLDVDTGKAVCKWYADLIRDWTVEGLAYE